MDVVEVDLELPGEEVDEELEVADDAVEVEFGFRREGVLA